MATTDHAANATDPLFRRIAEVARDLGDLQRLRAKRDALLRQLADYEARFGVPSSEVHAAIDDGRLVESDEVCRWLIIHDALGRSRWS